MDQIIRQKGAAQQKSSRTLNWALLSNLLQMDLPTHKGRSHRLGIIQTDQPEEERKSLVITQDSHQRPGGHALVLSKLALQQRWF